MKTGKFDYERKITNFIFPLIMMYIGTPMFFLYSISLLGNWIDGTILIADIWEQLLISSLVPILLPWFVLQEVNMFPCVWIDEEGLEICIYTYRRKRKKISWDEIADFVPSTSKFHGNEVWVITLKDRISFWHDILRRRYGFGDNHQLFVTSFLNGFDEFVKIVDEYRTKAEM